MIIKSVELNNFRNYENLTIGFGEKNNILYGDNAQGKTNVLESIYVCATTKSHKGSKDREIIKIGKEEVIEMNKGDETQLSAKVLSELGLAPQNVIYKSSNTKVLTDTADVS